MKPLAPTDVKHFLQRLHGVFASRGNTILAQILIVGLVLMIFVVEAAIEATLHGY